MKNKVCPKCNSEEIKKGLMAATVGQVHMYSEKTLGRNPLPYQQNIVLTAVTL